MTGTVNPTENFDFNVPDLYQHKDTWGELLNVNWTDLDTYLWEHFPLDGSRDITGDTHVNGASFAVTRNEAGGASIYVENMNTDTADFVRFNAAANTAQVTFRAMGNGVGMSMIPCTAAGAISSNNRINSHQTPVDGGFPYWSYGPSDGDDLERSNEILTPSKGANYFAGLDAQNTYTQRQTITMTEWEDFPLILNNESSGQPGNGGTLRMVRDVYAYDFSVYGTRLGVYTTGGIEAFAIREEGGTTVNVAGLGGMYINSNQNQYLYFNRADGTTTKASIWYNTAVDRLLVTAYDQNGANAKPYEFRNSALAVAGDCVLRKDDADTLYAPVSVFKNMLTMLVSTAALSASQKATIEAELDAAAVPDPSS